MPSFVILLSYQEIVLIILKLEISILRSLPHFLISSVPLAFIGGSLSINKEIFEILLFVVLTLAGVLLLVKFKSFDQKIEVYRKIPKMLSLLIGASIGFVSGVVGIGGGIFLSPILLID